MRVVILGGNIAGSNAADIIKREAPEMEVEIFTEDANYDYSRIKLPAFLGGRMQQAELMAHSAEWYESRNITFNRNCCAVQLIPKEKRVLFKDGQETTYDKLLLCIGSRSNILPLPGIENEGVFTLKTLEDALRIREYAKTKGSAIVIGGGLLGLEIAKSLTDLKLEVTVLEVFPRLLPRQLDVEGAEMLERILGDFNIKVGLNASTREITKNEELVVTLNDDRKFRAEMVVFAVGVKANVELARDAGIEVNKGIIVNSRMQTNIEDIYAAGDCAEYNGMVWGIVPVAFEQSKIAALNIIGKDVEYTEVVPSNTLKIVGVDLTSMGRVTPEEELPEEIKFVDNEKRIYKKIVVDGNRVIGAILLGDRTNQAEIMKLIKNKVDITEIKDKILDIDFNLKSIL